MNCSACGKLNSTGVSFCEFCGADLRSASAIPATPVTPSAADVAQIGKQIGKSFLNSLSPGEKFVGAGVIAAVLGFFLPAISVSVPDRAGQVVAFLLGLLGQSGGADAGRFGTLALSLFDITKLLGVVYVVLLLAIVSGVLLYFSKRSATPQKLVIAGFQVAIGTLYGPGTVLAMLFIPGMGSITGIGYWLLGLGFCSIAAGGLITIATLGKTAR